MLIVDFYFATIMEWTRKSLAFPWTSPAFDKEVYSFWSYKQPFMIVPLVGVLVAVGFGVFMQRVFQDRLVMYVYMRCSSRGRSRVPPR